MEEISDSGRAEETKTNEEDLEEKISLLLEELSKANTEKYDAEQAEKTAAGFLRAQADLAYFIGSVELKAKLLKREMERVTGEKYIKVKSGKKLSDAGVQHEINQDDDVLAAKNNYIQAESEIKKWNLMFGILKDGHIYFRNIGRGKNEW